MRQKNFNNRFISEPPFPAQRGKHRGFALISVLSILSLVALVAVGMLTLSTVTSRSGSATSDLEEARANARFAAMQALAKLQHLAGADTRITAPADIVSDTASPLTGVWRSWEGTDHQSVGLPIPPNYDSKASLGDPDKLPEDAAYEDGRFLGWLVSHPDANNPVTPPNLSEQSADTITLVGANSAGQDNPHVHLEPTLIENEGKTQGSYGWWVSGENQKASINVRAPNSDNTLDAIEKAKSNGFADLEHLNISNVTADNADRIISNSTIDLVNDNGSDTPVSQEYFYDITASAQGLLTNAATGGWKRDLSLFAENFADLDSSNLPLFTIKPGTTTLASKLTGPYPGSPAELLYPWSERPRTNNYGQLAATLSWDALADFATLYKNITGTSASGHIMMKNQLTNSSFAKMTERKGKQQRYPIVARLQWNFAYGAELKTPDVGPAGYQPTLVVNPIVTIWNPYNVQLNFENYTLSVDEASPLLFKFKVGSNIISSRSLNAIALASIGSPEGAGSAIRLRLPGKYSLRPGESLVFSPMNTTPQAVNLSGDRYVEHHITLAPGYHERGGLFYEIKGGPTSAPEDIIESGLTSFTLDEMTLGADVRTNHRHFKNTTGLRMIVGAIPDGGVSSQMTVIEHKIKYLSMAEKFYDFQKYGFPETTLQTVANKPLVFASCTYEVKGSNPDATLFTRGLVHSSIYIGYSKFTIVGSGHRVNLPTGLYVKTYTGTNSASPDLDTDNSGYVFTGSTSGDGQANVIVTELPTRPLSSLFELTHFDFIQDRAPGPTSSNIFGNSSARPTLLPEETTRNNVLSTRTLNYDDSYVINHLFADDWFVSSIAPELKINSKTVIRDNNKVYEDHVKRVKPLVNNNYIPSILADNDSPEKDITDNESYLDIASRLLVKGMFNVNSTSVKAWSSLLRHNKDADVAFMNSSNGLNLDTNNSGYPQSRYIISGASEANKSPSNQFTGYRNFTETQIDALAENIVAEIKARGPFLSLSEFLNRKLTSDKDDDKALSGAVQRALDKLAEEKSSAKNPFIGLINQINNKKITLADIATYNYKFPKAGIGYTGEGSPGWTRQADILRPLAPIISVRDDSFVIRAYGDKRDSSGEIMAQAWCEMVVERTANYFNPVDSANAYPAIQGNAPTRLTSSENARLGRRFSIASFRWLQKNDI